MSAPFDVVTPVSERIWDLKYRFKAADGTPVDRTLADTWTRVAAAAAGAEPAAKAAWEARFGEAMADFAFLPAGRIIAGAGTGRAVTLFNCFVMGTIEDDMASIFENVKEAALTMQQGGGIGHDFSTLRPRGAPVASIGAEASGPVSFMDVWDAMCRTIMSAGTRRGAMMATLACDHPDIELFVAAKRDPARLRMFNLSVLVTDAFMEAVRADADWDLSFGGRVFRTVRARILWDRILRATYDYAEPGVIFIDRVNRLNNLGYCEDIRATNPCLAADAWILTVDGPRRVADLTGSPFTAIADGQTWPSDARGFFSRGRKPTVMLRTREGHELRLTADHRVRRMARRTRWSFDWEWAEAVGLEPGDKVMLHDHRQAPAWGRAVDAEREEAEGYLLGMLVGDGVLKEDKAVLSVWPGRQTADGALERPGVAGVMKQALEAARRLPHRADFAGWIDVPERGERRMALGALKRLARDHDLLPGAKRVTDRMEERSSAFQAALLRGLFDADGSVQGTHDKGISVRLAQSDIDTLKAVQRMALRLGIASTLYRNRRPAGTALLPDGRSGRRFYPTRAQHELVISGDNLAVFAERVGFCDMDKAGRLERALRGYRRELNRERFLATVASVEPAGEAEVFDAAIPSLNAFDANGFWVHNCGEQPLPPHGACLLGSINLTRLVRDPFGDAAALDEARLDDLARLAVRFLDNVIDVSGYPLEAQRKEAMGKRRIGLGVTGLADALIMCGVRYGSDAAAALAERWMARIARAAYFASAELAAEKGPFPLFERDRFLAAPAVAALDEDVRSAIARHGIRNGLLTSIAPTGTISLLAGNVSSGVEPVFDFAFRRRVLRGDGTAEEQRVEDYAYRLHRHMFGAGAALTDAFVTTADLAPREHLAMQAALQRHVDSAISKTVNCPEDMTFDAFKDVYDQAYDLGLKGCTTYRPNPVTGAVLTAGEARPGAAPTSPPPAAPAAAAPAAHGDVVYMAEPLQRDAALAGITYKLKWPESDHAIYVTINDIVQDGRRRPFEIFINSKNLEHYAWTVALTRMISAVFRRGGDVSFVVEELKAVFDPRGGHWIEGRYVPSLMAAIGATIERHLIDIGFIQGPEPIATPSEDAPPARCHALYCPRCGQPSLVFQEGCHTCRACGYSKCS